MYSRTGESGERGESSFVIIKFSLIANCKRRLSEIINQGTFI